MSQLRISRKSRVQLVVKETLREVLIQFKETLNTGREILETEVNSNMSVNLLKDGRVSFYDVDLTKDDVGS